MINWNFDPVYKVGVGLLVVVAFIWIGCLSSLVLKIPALQTKLEKQEELIKNIKISLSTLMQHKENPLDGKLTDKLVSGKREYSSINKPEGKGMNKKKQLTKKEEFSTGTSAESPIKYETLIETKKGSKKEGFEAETEETGKDIPEIPTLEKEIEEMPPAQKNRFDIAETAVSKKEHRISSISNRKEAVYKVLAGDNLFDLSKKFYGDESKWIKIYEANLDKIQYPNFLRVDQELLIPDITVSKREDKKSSDIEPGEETFAITRKHIVRAGDTLYELAMKYYANSSLWEKIYYANEDVIENKNIIKTGQTIAIPE